MGPGFESQRDHEKGQNEIFHFVPFAFQQIPNCQILLYFLFPFVMNNFQRHSFHTSNQNP